MQLAFNIRYLTNEQGFNTAVQLPIKEWEKLIKEYNRLQKLLKLKKEIKSGINDIISAEKGRKSEILLVDFLNEC